MARLLDEVGMPYNAVERYPHEFSGGQRLALALAWRPKLIMADEPVPIPDPVLERSKVSIAVRGELPSAADPPSGCRFRTRCPLAHDVCAEAEPPLRPPSGTGNHVVACYFPLVT